MKALLPILSLVAAVCCGCTHPRTYQSPYNLGFISPGMKFLSLPATVQNTVRSQAGLAEIEDIRRYEVDNFTYYKVWFVRSGSFPPLYIAPNGDVLNSDFTISMSVPPEDYSQFVGHGFETMALSDLPPEVVKTIQTRAPSSEVLLIEKSGTETDRIYEVQFKGPNAPAPINVNSKGEVLKHGPIIDNRPRRR